MMRRILNPMLMWLCTCLLMSVACSDDGGGDGGGDDTGGGVTDTGGGGGEDAGVTDTYQPPASGESLIVAYVTHTRGGGDTEEWDLLVTDEDCEPDRCDSTQVTGDFSCQRGCKITPNMDYILWMDPSENGTLRISALSGAYEAGESRVVSQNVELWQYGSNNVVFSRGGTVYAQALTGGDDREIIAITSQDGRGLPGGFHYAPSIDAVIANIPTSLSAMDLWEVSVSNPSERTLLYHFIADVEQTTGSFYQNQQQVSVSPDGATVAIFTEALDNAQSCDPSAPSCDDEYRCSSNSNRCVGEQLMLHLITRADASMLSTPGNNRRCSADGECGAGHDCDMSIVDSAGLGECVPGKLVLGAYGRFACTDTPDGDPYLDAGEYEHVISGPLWRSDGRIVFVGRNNCVSANIDVTDLVAVNTTLDNVETVISSTGGDHGGPSCYDDVELDFTPAGCNIEIQSAVMSPSGNTVLFRASSVRSATDSEAWIVDAFGRGGKHDLTRDILLEVVDLQVFDE